MTHRVIPHSQLTDKAPPEIFEALRKRLFSAFPVDVEQRESCISVEKAEALWMREGSANGPACSFMRVPGSREFAHLHPDHDTSMHCNLPPEVEAEVLKKGWGERHPKYDVGVKETLIFGPRNAEEIEIVMRIVKESYLS